jgi:hypothetical protein
MKISLLVLSLCCTFSSLVFGEVEQHTSPPETNSKASVQPLTGAASQEVSLRDFISSLAQKLIHGELISRTRTFESAIKKQRDILKKDSEYSRLLKKSKELSEELSGDVKTERDDLATLADITEKKRDLDSINRQMGVLEVKSLGQIGLTVVNTKEVLKKPATHVYVDDPNGDLIIEGDKLSGSAAKTAKVHIPDAARAGSGYFVGAVNIFSSPGGHLYQVYYPEIIPVKKVGKAYLPEPLQVSPDGPFPKDLAPGMIQKAEVGIELSGGMLKSFPISDPKSYNWGLRGGLLQTLVEPEKLKALFGGKNPRESADNSERSSSWGRDNTRDYSTTAPAPQVPF